MGVALGADRGDPTEGAALGRAVVLFLGVVPNVVVTDGPHGAYVRFGGAEAHVPAFACEPRHNSEL